MWAESRTETILIAFKEAIRNGVPVMAHGSCRASEFSQLEANRRNLLNSFTLCKGITCISKSYMGNHAQRFSASEILEVESRSVYILATDDPPGRITWNTSQRWTSLTSSMMRSRVSCMLMALSCRNERNALSRKECTLATGYLLWIVNRVFFGMKNLGSSHEPCVFFITVDLWLLTWWNANPGSNLVDAARNQVRVGREARDPGWFLGHDNRLWFWADFFCDFLHRNRPPSYLTVIGVFEAICGSGWYFHELCV